MPGASGAKVATPAPPVPKSGDVSKPGRPPVARGPAAKDPRFAALLAQVQRNAKRQKTHPSAAQKAAEAQAAAKPPANEKTAGAKANSVDAMQEAKAEKPKTSGFLEMLRAEIEKVMPRTLDDTQRFMEGGEKDAVKNAVKGGVSESKAGATGPTEEAAAAPPDTGAVPTRSPTEAPADPAQPTEALDARNAVPVPKSNAAISQEQKSKDADAQMKEAEVTDTQLKKANDPRFAAVVDAKGDVKAKVAAAPGQYRQGEKAALAAGVAGATAVGRGGLAGMVAGRARGGTQVKTRQQLAKERDERRRKAVTDRIEGIFAATKQKVVAKLSTLETDVMAVFDAGTNLALADMKAWSDQQIDKFKDDRYSGGTGKARWVADLFRPCPEGIKAILRQAKTRFSAAMDALAVRISAMVDARLAAAKAEITKGQADVASYVASLPADLKSVGKAAQEEVQGRFKELEDGIESKKQELASALAQKFKEANDKADAELKKIEEANAGALKKFADKLGEIIKIIAEFKDKLMAALRKGWETIKLILADPIGFLGNLIAAVKGGISAFVANFGKHLMAGLAKWLFGNLASAGITMPSDLSLASIFKLVMQILGLTYANIRARAVKLVGEPVVKAVETMAEFIAIFIRGGPAALWAHIKEQLSDLKSMVIDAIIGWVTSTIITQAATKLVSMFNPAGAFVQACIAIYNIVMFIIERAQQILAFIEAVINSVHAIATGSIGGAIAWIERSLAATIPLVISFFARLIGLGGITAKILGIIKAVQEKVNKGIDWVLGKIIGGLKKLIARTRGSPDPKERTGQLHAAVQEAKALATPDAEPGDIESKLSGIKAKHKLTALELKRDGRSGADLKVHIRAKGSPEEKSPAFILKGWSKQPVGPVSVPRTSVRWTDRLKRTVYRRWVKRVGAATAGAVMDKTGTFRPGAPITVHRRHVISYKNYKDHLQNNLPGMTVDKAAEALHSKQVSAVATPALDPKPKANPQRKQIEAGARELANRFNNDASNIWIGDAIENIQRKWMVDPSPKIEAGEAGVVAALARHIQKMEAKYALPGKSLEVSTPFGQVTWQLVTSMASPAPVVPAGPAATLGAFT